MDETSDAESELLELEYFVRSRSRSYMYVLVGARTEPAGFLVAAVGAGDVKNFPQYRDL